ncbi:MAG TPA: hypothetical protein VMZ91_04380 [Candidatus Paceibacterota bacterium]|nr:hypothetical protein [Candidatus Paceibacterota bacterium]
MIFPSILALNLNIEKQSSNEVMIAELKNAVIFNLKITNIGASDNFEFYNILGFDMLPTEKISISEGQTKDIQIKIFPREGIKHRGFYTLKYFIRGQEPSNLEEQELTFKLIDLKDAFEIGSGEVDPESNSIKIYVHNKVNFEFDEIKAKFNSAFFNFERNFSLEANEKREFSVQLNKEDFRKLMAGFYTLKAEINVQDQKTELEGIIKFIEKNVLTTTKKHYGFIINTQIIEKINEGNVLVDSETVLKKNIVSRLFTSFSPQPDIVERQGLIVYYTWNKKIKPGETLEINVKTNWLLPLLVILFIVVIVVLVKQCSKTNLSLRKKVSFVKAKGGEFALKVSILVNAKKYVERISIIDKLPMLVKVYERFGGEKPTRINEKNRRIEWTFEKLEEGETRMLSYIIYSKIGILGKFALPSATAVYERDGKISETTSNRAFFIAEQRKGDIED